MLVKATRIFVIIACVALTGAVGLATLGVYPSLARVFPEATLQRAHSFDSPGIGIAGTPSPYGIAVAELAERGDTRAFERLLRQDHAVQQLYGLTGLYLLDRQRYEVAVAPFRGDSARLVEAQLGCMGLGLPISWAVASIDSGDYPMGYVSGYRGEW